MKKLRKLLLWSLVFLLLLIGLDQLLLRVPLEVPVAREMQTFYRDFRSRLFALGGGSQEPTIDEVIEQAAQPSPAPAARQGEGEPRYLYVDKTGALQFADSLDDVPEAFRASAEKLKN